MFWYIAYELFIWQVKHLIQEPSVFPEVILMLDV